MKKQNGVEAYPLCWPDGWPRTAPGKRTAGHQFKSGDSWTGSGTDRRYVGKNQITFARAARLLFDEMGRLHATNLVISTNARVRNDGGVYADDAARRYDDPGVAIYFMLKGKPMVMAQDAFDNLAANLRSLGLAVEAMRALERHGGGAMMERAFGGFTALPAPEGSKPKRPWWEVMRYSADPAERELLSVREVEARHVALSKRLHPDAGGSHDEMAELNQAKDDAVAELEGNQ